METVKLQRLETGEEGTFGRLTFGNFSCYTGELPWKYNTRQQSCIPTGTYACRLRQSPKFGRVYEVTGVPNRSFILIHGGNFSGDVSRGYTSHVEGCILLGNRFGYLPNKAGAMQRAVLASSVAVGAFMRTMGYQPFLLQVVSAFNNSEEQS